MIRRPPRSTLDRSSAASDVYKRQTWANDGFEAEDGVRADMRNVLRGAGYDISSTVVPLSLIHISEPTRPY